MLTWSCPVGHTSPGGRAVAPLSAVGTGWHHADVHTLVYSSVAATALDEDELELLLGSSRHGNAAAGITGILLQVVDTYGRGAAFVQVLEGDAAAVEALYERIAQDELHSDLRVLVREEVPERAFQGWTMRCEQIPARDLIGHATDAGTDAPQGGDDSLSFRALRDALSDATRVRSLIARFAGPPTVDPAV